MSEELFQSKLKRMSLLNLPRNSVSQKFAINVFRNHSFEMVENIIHPFLNFSQIDAEFIYSDYDDSLNYGNIQNSDFNMIWLDLGRYKNIDIESWLEEKMNELYSLTHKPVLLIYVSDKKIRNLNVNFDKFYCFSVNDELNLEEDKLYDYIKEPFSGTRLSNPACVQFARTLGMKIIPAIIKTPLKAIVFDMDNTLYDGILGEDGFDGIKITDTHKNIYKKMLELKNQGFMICIASKNEEEDGVKFFESFKPGLAISDFAAIQINWDSKYDNLIKIAKQLNIGTDSILFIDDNPAEIQNVEATGVKTFLAKNPELTLNALNYYPGLLKLKISKEDSLRTKDIQANQERELLAKQLSPKEYFEKLQIVLDFYINNSEQFERVEQLLNKTNQFILTYGRFNRTQIENFASNGAVLTINMSDKLSDSGVIAILVTEKGHDNIIDLKEMTVSCRALGRNLENVMLPMLFKIANAKLNGNGNIRINYRKGPRNMPAINWLSSLLSVEIVDDEGSLVYEIPNTVNTEGLVVNVYEEQNV